MKLIRDGSEDYEYLKFLADHGKRAEALQVARGLFPKMYQASRSDAQVQAARQELANMIGAMVG